MDKGTFSFDLLDKYPPDIVIANLLKQIEEVTRGYVIGNIDSYDGPIYSYMKETGLGITLGALQAKSEVVDIQKDLGEQGVEQNNFEVYLTVKGLEHYKYRMMFVGYSTIAYPATIVMNEELAIAYSGKRNAVFIVESMKALEDMINVVINSEKMAFLIQNLINESLRQEARAAKASV